MFAVHESDCALHNAPAMRVGQCNCCLSTLTWEQAAKQLGERLKSDGPPGYYEMTPAQWLEWALNTPTVFD